MHFEQFYAEINKSLKQYASAGLIDEMSVYDWVIEALNGFRLLPTIKVEAVLNVRNNSAKLPEGFKTLYSAIKCEPHQYTIDIPEEDVLQDFHFYKVRELKNEDWNFCNPCDIVETDSCIVEKTYLHNNLKANFYYKNLQPLKLKLTPYVKRTLCDKECVNLSVNDAPYEISINNKTIYTNFKEGNIFMIYNGYEHDEDGFLIIPDTEEDNMSKYLQAYVKKRIIEQIMADSDNTTNEQFLYSMYAQEEEKYYTRTMGELKLKRVLYGMDHYRSKLKKQFSVYDFGKYSHNHHSQKVGFIIV